ncbi:twitching motility protein PilT [Arenicella chitinivorans]|uniref:Twitching motility protein PilT n=1 Tax=Arenicella chitinivorans TaxID=1329800 RepID=A0A918RP11_9GAMM|nr:PilT/PilU family type 4a pilus ATPase [Arenicella chitinivorans]GHA05694.1 twitching motility protein PilT [Arenicella chitinivorans]
MPAKPNSITEQLPDTPQVKEALEFLTSIVGSACQFKASDIHIRAGHQIMMRLDGRIRQVKGSPEMSDEMIERLIYPLMSKYHLSLFKEENQVDLSLSDNKGNRVRVNMFRQLGQLAVVMRVIENVIPDPDALGLPEQVRNIARMRQGLIIFSGATGSGKSTSMASLLNEINRDRYQHILTIEDPVEYVFTEQRCVISQRQVGIDVPDFARAMKAALREDPDVILMGEMRDPESIEIALTAAETGHLVFSTLHAPNSADAITRMVSSFGGDEQPTIRAKLAHNLRAIVTQRLLPKKEGAGRTVACEVLTVTPLARELIVDPMRIKEIKDLIKGGDKVEGMLHFDEHLMQLVRDDVITDEIALTNASSSTDLALKLKGF